MQALRSGRTVRYEALVRRSGLEWVVGFSVVCAAAASANPAILLYPSIGTTTQVTVRGRVLREAPTRGSSTMSKNMRLLAGDTWEGATVDVRFAGRAGETVSGANGDFTVVVPAGAAPFEVGVGLVEARVRGARSVSVMEVPQKVVLVGDSGERDPEVYAQIQAEFPDRVLATYIHDVGRSQDPRRFRNMMLFKSAFEAGADSVGRGLAEPECLKAWLHP